MQKLSKKSNALAINLFAQKKYQTAYTFFVVKTYVLEYLSPFLEGEPKEAEIFCAYVEDKLSVTICHPNHLLINHLQMQLERLTQDLFAHLESKKILKNSDNLVVKLRFK